jgi:hypothetical protein
VHAKSLDYRDRKRYRDRKDGGTGHWRVAGHNPRPLACAATVGPDPDPDFDSDFEDKMRRWIFDLRRTSQPGDQFVLGVTLIKGEDPREPSDSPATVTRLGLCPGCRPLVIADVCVMVFS